ncbi:hypothetical protein HK104_005013 [Borealophlyctis nickersoniae]|nr:hypothetical protein HK104_005013 [Borealophlyctis nickersoniae]
MTEEERKRLLVTDEMEGMIDMTHEEILLEIQDQKFGNDQNPTQWEIDNLVNPDDTRRCVDEYCVKVSKDLKHSTTEMLENAAHAALMVLENNGAPRRNEYAWLTANEKDDNYYKDGFITLRKYKTSSHYGAYTFEVSPHTRKILDELINRKKKMGVRQIFGRPTVKDIWNHWTEETRRHFTAVVGKPLNSRLLRKYYVTYQQLNGKLVYDKDRRELARRMGNKVHEQQKVYTIRLTELDPSNETASTETTELDPSNETALTETTELAPSNETALTETEDVEVMDDADDESMTTEENDGRKRKPKVFWEEEEVKDLEKLIGEVGYDPKEIRKAATDKGLLLARRSADRIRHKSEQIKVDREASGVDLGVFAVVPVRTAILSRKKAPLNLCEERDLENEVS